MSCGTKCGAENNDDKEYQDLSGWKGITLEELLFRLKAQSAVEVRIYNVASTRLDKNLNTVRHLGSGPNLEGGLASLCTCKHSMRQNHTLDGWKGLWILGVTSRAIDKGFCGEHYLFYMMKVAQAFKSHKDFHEFLTKENRDALRIKNAVKNRLGDIFEPIYPCVKDLDPIMYKTPHKNHSHGSHGDYQWHSDIAYNLKSAPLLLGDVENTFVWPQPMIKFKANRGAGNIKLKLGEDLYSLLETHENAVAK